ncbi:MAG: bifunctional diaminohydroxyphosphoribosylaminopyrimidine deaminase/5-amino-6-(5-phosphoribosylamino)uracil reductase RibD, partial [Pseudomonadota bacterium]
MTTDTARDLRFMDQAIALARTGLGQTWPRPSVGCVLVKGDEVVGAGRTDGTRPAHAEAVALAAAGARAHGATAYVTLEPCAHHGATPPCADALVAAGIARAVVAIRDPDPRTNGAGLAILRQAGIEVATGCRAEAAAEAQAGFLTRVTLGRPRLILKLAMTLDGRIATATGESRWITGPAARAEVHTARAASDAVMIGAGTARVDDPSLTVRDAPAPPR